MHIITIFGSNSGDKQRLIDEAATLLSRQAGRIVNRSSYYETAPWGFECKEYFLNQVIVFDSPLHPESFLAHALKTEQQLGRQRIAGGPRYTSRPIDIDLLFCESLILNTPVLTIPHPRIAERRFVLAPLAEIIPEFIHPTLHKTIAAILRECPDPLKVTVIN